MHVGQQQHMHLNVVFDLSLTWVSWGVTRMRWCHLWELLGFELGVSVHLPASRGTLLVVIGAGVCVCRCVVGSCSCVLCAFHSAGMSDVCAVTVLRQAVGTRSCVLF